MYAFNIWCDNKLIDTVYCELSGTIKESMESVRSSLIHHDGYSSEIKVTWPKGQRVTVDEYDVEGDYGYGWEIVTCESTYSEARKRLREYERELPGYYQISHKRVRKCL